jgi:hypothetical protein
MLRRRNFVVPAIAMPQRMGAMQRLRRCNSVYWLVPGIIIIKQLYGRSVVLLLNKRLKDENNITNALNVKSLLVNK